MDSSRAGLGSPELRALQAGGLHAECRRRGGPVEEGPVWLLGVWEGLGPRVEGSGFPVNCTYLCINSLGFLVTLVACVPAGSVL